MLLQVITLQPLLSLSPAESVPVPLAIVLFVVANLVAELILLPITVAIPFLVPIVVFVIVILSPMELPFLLEVPPEEVAVMTFMPRALPVAVVELLVPP